MIREIRILLYILVKSLPTTHIKYTGLYVVYCAIMYIARLHVPGIEVSDRGSHLLAGFVSFLLVFRLNQCYGRYQVGIDTTQLLFTYLHNIAAIGCGYLRAGNTAFFEPGTESAEELKHARMVRVNVCRYVIAFAVSVKCHSRICRQGLQSKETMLHNVLDVLRLSGLLTNVEARIIASRSGLYEERMSDSLVGSGGLKFLADFNKRRNPEEFSSWTPLFPISEDWSQLSGESNGHAQQDGYIPWAQASAMPPLIIHLLRTELYRAINKPWGFPERTLNILEFSLRELHKSFECFDRLVRIPQPKPYTYLCYNLMTFFLLTYPLHIEMSGGTWANVVSPGIIGIALTGIMCVAGELENPIGDDPCDLNLLEMIHGLEVEIEQIFDLSETQMDHVRRSAGELAESFDLGTAKATQEESKPVPLEACAFVDFFEWKLLPARTLRYVLHKRDPEDTASLYSTLSAFRDPDWTGTCENRVPGPRLLARNFANSTPGHYGHIEVAKTPPNIWRYHIGLRSEHARRVAFVAEQLDSYPIEEIQSFAYHLKGAMGR
eukprot:gnl/MRDRNA2_/MRDRNA2_106905_c0_seq1.p1 gnl/MRDRNA2_/MRDRNA2_106905_c0~~gnl/MRDRNA2_/MRDRNA2_106905_c0_seq1.p1  ORF type:complete len:549 (+),score=59.69 gnl/MRDRNA2_/MRDRNA2_106905_c0_seq1:94-1740(+)